MNDKKKIEKYHRLQKLEELLVRLDIEKLYHHAIRSQANIGEFKAHFTLFRGSNRKKQIRDLQRKIDEAHFAVRTLENEIFKSPVSYSEEDIQKRVNKIFENVDTALSRTASSGLRLKSITYHLKADIHELKKQFNAEKASIKKGAQ
ncbi:MAG: hypothetical protein HYX61_12050 [Gammaproteobacteria bacterium]|nr:hypothetical protein [Gammaproteobacteria bacterium]